MAKQEGAISEVTSQVLITCPESGEPVGAVLRLRPSALAGLSGEYSFRCTRCGQVHRWSKDEAWLKPNTQDKPVTHS